MRTAIRVVLLTVLMSIIFALAGRDILRAEPAMKAASAAKPACDRECLRGFMTKYLDALIAHKPGGLPVSKKGVIGSAEFSIARKLFSFYPFIDYQSAAGGWSTSTHRHETPQDQNICRMPS